MSDPATPIEPDYTEVEEYEHSQNVLTEAARLLKLHGCKTAEMVCEALIGRYQTMADGARWYADIRATAANASIEILSP